MFNFFKKNLLIIFFVFALNSSAGFSQTFPSAQSSVAKEPSLSLIKEITSLKLSNPLILYMLFNFVELFLHECGHGLTSMAFEVDSFEGIHLLCSPKNWNTHYPLINLGKLKIHGNGLANVTHFNYAFEEKYKNLLRLVAGPLTGIFMCHLVLFAINLYAQYSDKKEIFKSAKNGISNLYSPFQTILNSKQLSIKSKHFLINLSFVVSLILIRELFYGVTPNRYGLSGIKLGSARNDIGDGISLWRDFILEKNKSLWLRGMSIASAVLEWSSYGYLLVKYAKALRGLNQAQQI